MFCSLNINVATQEECKHITLWTIVCYFSTRHHTSARFRETGTGAEEYRRSLSAIFTDRERERKKNVVCLALKEMYIIAFTSFGRNIKT